MRVLNERANERDTFFVVDVFFALASANRGGCEEKNGNQPISLQPFSCVHGPGQLLVAGMEGFSRDCLQRSCIVDRVSSGAHSR